MATESDSLGPSQVRPGLYIGGLQSLHEAGVVPVTHVLSLAAGAESLIPSAVHKIIGIEDTEDENLLEHLNCCCSFISEALLAPGSAVLVHCNAGVSRSAAAVVAHLMRSEKSNAEAALESLQSTYPSAQPNDGFMEQLRLFHQMGCKLDPSNEAYKRFNLQQHGRRWEAHGYVDREQLQEVGHDEAGLGSSVAVERYRCRKCRTIVASSLHTVDVEQGPGQGAFPFYKRVKVGKGAPAHSKESSLFVEPLRWMEAAIAQHNGKLYCPTCNERLGSFNWAGIQSNSGSWVVPAFQLHLSKLDTISAAFDTALMGSIRQPRPAPG